MVFVFRDVGLNGFILIFFLSATKDFDNFFLQCGRFKYGNGRSEGK